MSARLRLEHIDIGPDDLAPQLPLEAQLLRQIPGTDRPDYFMCVVDRPIRYRTTLEALRALGVSPEAADPQLIQIHEDGTVDLQVFGIVIASRIDGAYPHAGMKDFPVMLAYVIDSTAMRDEILDFSKLVYAAVAFVSDVGSDENSTVPAS